MKKLQTLKGIIGGQLKKLDSIRHITNFYPSNLYKQLFEKAQYGIIIFDLESGKIINTNPYLTDFTGIDSKSMIGKKVWDLNLFEGKELLQRSIDEIKTNGYSHIEEMYVREKNGRTKPVEFISNVFSENGHKIVQSCISGISKRKQKQDALKLSEMRFKEISEGTREWIWEVDLNGIYTYLNPVVKDLIGYSSEELLGKVHFYDFFEPEKKEEMKKQAFEIFARKEVLKNFVNCNIHKAGHKVYLSTNGFPILDSENNLIGYRGVDIDITAQYEAEEALRQSETKTRTILEAISTGIIIVDPETHAIVDVNTEAARLFGVPKYEIINNSCHKFICPAEEGNCPVTNLRQTIDNSERILLNKNGESIPILKSVTQVNIDGRKLLIENFTDITDRKKTEENLRNEKERYKAITNAIPDMMFRLDRNGRYLDFKADVKELLVQTENIIGKLNRDITPPEFADLIDQKIEETLKTGETQTFEYQLTVPGVGICDYDARMVASGKEEVIAFVRDITEQKRYEKALKESEERLDQIMENVEAVFYMMSNKTGQVLYINSAYEKIWGHTKKEIMRDPLKWIDAIYMDDRLAAVNLYENGEGEAQYRINAKDGTTKWILDRMFPIMDEKGDIEYLCGMATDITQSKKADEVIRESEAKLEEATKIAKLATWEYDVRKKLFTFNDQFYSLLHTTAQQEGGYTMSGEDYLKKFIHPDDIETLHLEAKKAILTTNPGYSNQFDHRVIYPNGEIGYITVNTRIEKDFAGHTIRIYGVKQDITERKRSEESLKLFRSLIDKSNDAIEVVDPETGRFLDANERACTDLGYTREELLKLSVFDIDPDRKWKNFKQVIKALRHSDSTIIETTHIKKDGTIFPVEVNVNIVELEKTYLIAVVRDITVRKKEEQELIDAKNKAEESDRLKSAFLANMSHEIRTPMNGILGFTELLKEPKLSGEEQQKYINIIEKSGLRMLNIINDIISISKIESGQIEVSLLDTNINDQMEYIYHFFKKEAEQKNLELILKKRLPKEEAIIKTDKEKIYAVLINLVKNALKFTTSGSIEFGCAKKGEFLEFFVKDTGPGIEEKQREIIFERFRQGSESLNRDYEGAGLGLAISKGYIEMLGGKIWVYPNLYLDPDTKTSHEKGTIFYFNVPVKPLEGPKVILDSELTENKTETRSKKLKVLIAEDDEVSGIYITRLAKDFANEIINVSNGEEAVETCKNNPDTDLILMDMKMPVADGYEASKRIREFNKDVIIIAQTAYGMVGDKEKSIEAGCNDYISKPVNRDNLNKILDKYFK
ncbi:MAG: PAS domain S-box protein [Bacteroidales bacterium]|nr:PAS domain S-box protein [Bacteroidales bacterium]